MRRLLAWIAAACLALSLTGCELEQPEPEPSEAPTPTPVPSEEVEEVRFCLGYDPAASLDPITGDSQVNQDLTGLVYQTLFVLDNTFQPRPLLAQSAASSDSRTWTITLREDVTFSDGTPLTARHAADSLNAARNSALYSARLSGVSSVSARDNTLTIHLNTPNGEFPALLDIPVVLEQGDGLPPLGTGCYQYEAQGDGWVLRPNPQSPSRTSLPFAEIPLTPVSTQIEQAAAFDSGKISAVTADFSGPNEVDYSASFETCDYPTTNLLYVGFRAASGPCRSNLVRRAFSQALDRESMCRVQLSGHGDPAALPISPLSPDSRSGSFLAYDLESAAGLLDEAGWQLSEEDGLRYQGQTPLAVTLLVNNDNEARQAVADWIAEALQALGVTVTVSRLPWNEYTAALSAGNFDLFVGEVQLTADFDPTVLLTGRLNCGGFENWDLTQAIAQWKAARGDERTATAFQLWTLFELEAPIAPLCFKRASLLVRWGMASNLQPIRANPFSGIEQWSVDGP